MFMSIQESDIAFQMNVSSKLILDMGYFLQTLGNVLQSALTIILILEFIIGNLGNAFLVLVKCMDWIKRRKISLVNQILTALAISRLFSMWSLFTGKFLYSLYPTLFMTEKMIRMMHPSWTVTNHFSIWLATCLSIFYFLKIANFSNSIFLYLKWRVKKAILVTLLVSLVLLFLNIFLITMHIEIWIDGSKRNASFSFNWSYSAELYRLLLILNTIFFSVPFAVSLTTFLLLIFSLWKHHKKMQHNAQGCRDASTTAHIKALQTVITFLLLYAIYFLSLFVQLWKSELLEKNLFTSFCQMIAITFPSAHSFVLILGDTKLREISLSLLCWLRCRSKDMEPSGS